MGAAPTPPEPFRAAVVQAAPVALDVDATLERVAAQGLVYVEMFFDPQAHTDRGLAFDTVIAGLLRARQDAEARLGIRSQLIMCFLRDMSAESAAETLRQARPYRDWIVGVVE